MGLRTLQETIYAGHPSGDVPLHCFLGQHAVPGEESYTADNRQVLQGLEHVQMGPVDVHQAQHG